MYANTIINCLSNHPSGSLCLSLNSSDTTAETSGLVTGAWKVTVSTTRTQEPARAAAAVPAHSPNGKLTTSPCVTSAHLPPVKLNYISD
ncbi:hypothetical protein E2C01_029232 [Portunus trituberculatus]|uniref:Uncharacterized protein n=1 Tax=Portunus trituberculatus TaxID=210409 RepID=A0A5B7ERE8_PORTR|nr:hypothetical protein [Portunus trituberculatus]